MAEKVICVICGLYDEQGKCSKHCDECERIETVDPSDYEED